MLRPDTITSSQLLDFAGIEPLLIPTVAIEQHIAEKLHAYTRTYAGNQPSSRVKDLVDLAVIAHTTTVDAERLTIAISEIFARRGTHPVPATLPSPPDDWASGWRQRAAGVPVEVDPVAGHKTVAAMLDPILSEQRERQKSWDSVELSWGSHKF